jgi:hypothetical protein
VHQAKFVQPLRVRARHIFLAAPEAPASGLMEAEQCAIADIVARDWMVAKSVANLLPPFLKMKPAKARGGDLGFFAADRVLPNSLHACKG